MGEKCAPLNLIELYLFASHDSDDIFRFIQRLPWLSSFVFEGKAKVLLYYVICCNSFILENRIYLILIASPFPREKTPERILITAYTDVIYMIRQKPNEILLQFSFLSGVCTWVYYILKIKLILKGPFLVVNLFESLTLERLSPIHKLLYYLLSHPRCRGISEWRCLYLDYWFVVSKTSTIARSKRLARIFNTNEL